MELHELKLNKDKTINFTGHRVRGLFNSYDPNLPANKRLLWKLREVIIDYIDNRGYDTFITGMALGIDQWAARIIMKLREDEKYSHLKLVAAIPCANHSDKWPKESREDWERIKNACDLVHYVSEEDYTDGCMQRRNEWMVDHASSVIAVFKGGTGGTANCLLYAKQQGVHVTMIKPHSLNVQEGI